MNYKKNVICDVCGNKIDMPSARIEWGRDIDGGIHICHHECSLGIKSGCYPISDMILDQNLYSNEEWVFQRLNILKEQQPEYESGCERILQKIFED